MGTFSLDRTPVVNNSVVSPDMVARLAISRLCAECYPCKHQCQITLSDGRSVDVTLDGVTINSLIREIASEKIFGSDATCSPIDCWLHFDYYSDSSKLFSWKRETASEILTDLFQAVIEQ